MNQIESSADQIIPGLWLGNQASSQSDKFIRNAGIKAIVNATDHIQNKWEKPKSNGMSIIYFRVPVQDPGPTESEDQIDNKKMIEYLPSVIDFIHRNLQEGNPVLVHCHAGRIRSASIVLCYLLKYQFRTGPIKTRLHQAISLILSKRPCAFHFGEYSSFTPAVSRYIASSIV